jgi:hypothetical protein
MSDYDDNPQAAPEQQPANDPYASLEGLGYDPAETAAVQQVLHSAIDHHVQAAVEPLQRDLEHVNSTLDAEEHEAALLDLEEAYPELQNDANAERLLEQAWDYAAQVGDPELATDPSTLELLHLRNQAGGGPGRQQAQRSSPGVVRGNALAFDAGTPRGRADQRRDHREVGPHERVGPGLLGGFAPFRTRACSSLGKEG